MDDLSLHERLRASEQRNEALSQEVAALRAALAQLGEVCTSIRRDYEALVDATRIITEEPDRWAMAHPEAVRGDRIEEKAIVSDRKRYRRARARMQARAARARASR